MAQKKKLALPKFEVILIGVFFISFFLWALSKCSSNRRQMQEVAEQQAIEQAEYEASLAEAAKQAAKKDSTPPKPIIRTSRERYTPLYVTIDGMNVRSEPSKNAARVDRLKLFEEVQFLYEVTEFREEIDLGDEIANEPWVKIRTAKGKEGWIYGAGVNYYRTKRVDVE